MVEKRKKSFLFEYNEVSAGWWMIDWVIKAEKWTISTLGNPVDAQLREKQ